MSLDLNQMSTRCDANSEQAVTAFQTPAKKLLAEGNTSSNQMDFSSNVSTSKHDSMVIAFDPSNSPLFMRPNQNNSSRLEESMS